MLKSCIFWFKTSFVKDYRCLSPFGVVENTKSNEKFNNDIVIINLKSFIHHGV
jgi:hypothetical protein